MSPTNDAAITAARAARIDADMALWSLNQIRERAATRERLSMPPRDAGEERRARYRRYDVNKRAKEARAAWAILDDRARELENIARGRGAVDPLA